jgi:hypothetical protein
MSLLMNDKFENGTDDFDWIVYLTFDSEELSVAMMEKALDREATGHCYEKGDVVHSLFRPYVQKGIRGHSRLGFESDCADWPSVCRCLSEEVVPTIQRFRSAGMNARGEVDILYVGGLIYFSGSLPQRLVEECAQAGVTVSLSLNPGPPS